MVRHGKILTGAHRRASPLAGILLGEAWVLAGGLAFLVLLLSIPAGGREAVFGREGALGVFAGALRGAGDRERKYLADLLLAIGAGSLATLTLTLLATALSIGSALVCTAALEARRSARVTTRILSTLSPVPSFLVWVFLVLFGSAVDPPIGLVYIADARGLLRWILFWGSAVWLVGLTNGSYLAARQTLELERNRLRSTPFALAARSRGLASFSFYFRHLRIPAIAVGLERLGDILSNCLVVEMLMNIPGLSWRGKMAFETRGTDYAITWILIAIASLGFMRILNIAGRLWIARLDPRIRRPSHGGMRG